MRGPRLSALDAWLDRRPDARVAALGLDALPVPVPEEISLRPGQVIEERLLLDVVATEDRSRLARAFVVARRTGQAVTEARLADDGRSVEVCYIDLAPELPICIRLCSDHRSDAEVPPSALRQPSRPRLGIIRKDEAARIVELDADAVALLGWVPDDVIGSSTLDFIHPDDRARALENWSSMHLGGGSQVIRVRYRCGDGTWLWLDTSNSYDPDAAGAGSVICQVIDASEEMAAADALRRNEELLRRLTETVPVGLCFVTPDLAVSYLNPALAALLGTADVPDVDTLDRLLVGDQSQSLGVALREALREGHDRRIDVTLRGEGPSPLRCRVTLSTVLDQGDVTGALVCVVDVTELKRQATTDGLTGLLNQRALLETLRDLLDSSRQQTGVLFLDLDRFKPVNDEHGHRLGDLLLVAVAERLRAAVRDHDVLGRVGGDEFAVLCPGLTEPGELEGVAGRVVEVLGAPFQLGTLSVSVGVSVGLTFARDPQERPDDILQRADAAMYLAKRGGADFHWS